MNFPELQQRAFLVLLVVVSLAFAWILLPFYGAVFWASVLAIIFVPFYRRLLVVMHQRQILAALTTLLLSLIIAILPCTFITASLLQEGAGVYQRIKSGELNFGGYFQQVMSALPSWMVNFLGSVGLTNISELKEMLSNGALEGSQRIATEALNIGQNTFEFIISFGIMLYLLVFPAAGRRHFIHPDKAGDSAQHGAQATFAHQIHHCSSCHRQRQYGGGSHTRHAGWVDFLIPWYTGGAAMGICYGIPFPAASWRGIDLGAGSDLLLAHRRHLARGNSHRVWRIGDRFD